MIRPTASIHIDASSADVIGFIADPANAPRWMKALDVAELITPGPIDVGSRFREVHCEGWATTTGQLAEGEAAWARQAQREAEAELGAIKQTVEEGVTPR